MSSNKVDLKNIQGDIIIGLQKRVEAFWFCTLKSESNSVEGFRRNLKDSLLPLITTTQDVLDTQKKINDHKRNKRSEGGNDLLPITQVNLGFSFAGLKKLGLKLEEIPTGGDGVFSKGQKVDAVDNLGDPVDPKTKKLKTWSKDFLHEANSIDFVILITAPDCKLLDQKLDQLRKNLSGFLASSFVRKGNVRPGNEVGHEHFGFLDGISTPTIENINAQPGDKKSGIVKPDVVLLGQPASGGNTNNLDPKQAWIKDGSFMAFRELQQLVPEFQSFCDESAKKLQNPNVSGDFIGARIVGRWKSGAPLTLTPVQDKPELNRAQDFDYSDELKQERCPYAAHIRKTNPRNGIAGADPNTAVLPHLMIRNGIPYGPELTEEEKKAKKTKENRGLLFVSYQSQIESGFQFVQKLWCNNTDFPAKTPAKVTPGFDLLIGQTADEKPRVAQNINPLGIAGTTDPNNIVTAPAHFIVPLGGEYFLMPSIKAINEKLGLSSRSDL
ncbi:uncharacterized protein PGTG_12933 [Puccinia graminis f. sp. tritici CRL 75-36-700-3]|uniref:Dyp-type peroxidase n=1 Tax=Puccinia graminis f. sp. tritici (strain CRL 75-36-700-3 / race SCCL) TaxID=418459 RepID=E3KQH6_PUCGT|nr:uncharacterized protein PGTG_12933 [Puccinia graminis f. sp. tritici CRL 75-36-700-3]EFP86551.2 hypothetical protein PGTG_12933 [Puccinia graminis f. sp. tritici CRL 75-36-700-3]